MSEMGSNLEKYGEKAKKWFSDKKVEVPKGSAAWQKCSTTRGEIPPGMSYNTLYRHRVNISDLIAYINNSKSKRILRDPITKDVLGNLGFELIAETTVSKHKRLTVVCSKCGREETLDYGTFQRMRKAGNKYCRYCRKAGGKRKDLIIYNTFHNFTIVSRDKDLFVYQCSSCKNKIHRTMAHVSTSDYLVCEYCHPNIVCGTKINTKEGKFDSYLEYLVYLELLNYFAKPDIEQQVSYSSLFNTGTRHTADFFIKSINLVIEVYSTNTKFPKYLETKAWKEKQSDNVVFISSYKQVEDIVRPFLKD